MNRLLKLTVIALWIANLLGAAAPTKDTATEDDLIAILKSKASKVAKNKACRALKLVGTEKSIPVLAPLLTDKDLAHPARLAIDTMPYPAAGAALRDALGRAKGQVRAGLVDSLGERRDTSALYIVTKCLDDSDKQVVAAAAWALGKIATVDSAMALLVSYSKAAGEQRNVFRPGMVLCAKNLLRNGNDSDGALQNTAMALLTELSAASEPKNTRSAALGDLVRIKGPDRDKTIHDFLTSDDVLKRMAGAGVLPELQEAELAKVAEHVNDLPVGSEVSVLSAIRIRGDHKLLPAVLDALGSTNDAVCLAAIRALETVGDASALPPLLAITLKEGSTGEAARKSIALLGGLNVDATIFSTLRNEADPTHRAQWIDIVAYRRPTGAIDLLVAEAQHSDAVVRAHAMAALEQLATLHDLPGLLAGDLAAKEGPEREAAELSIVRIGLQEKDAEKRSQTVLAAIEAAPGDHLALLPLAGRFGGGAILTKMQAALADKDPHVHAAGLRALCNWPDASVADQLLELTKSADEPSNRAMLLHAFTRVVSLPTAGSTTQRLDRLKQAMELAQSDTERGYVLERAGAVRSVESLRFVLPYVDQPALAETACKAVADLAHHKEVRDPNKAEFGPALEKVMRTSKERLILERVKRYLEAMRAA